MIWATFTLAFFDFLHCSEFTYPGVNLFRSHLDLSTDASSFHPSLDSPHHISVTLKSSKTDFFRRGHCLLIARSGAPLCAVRAMGDYFLNVRPQPRPLFVF